MSQYKWKVGSRLSADAQSTGERLEELRQQHNGLTPEIVLDDAQRTRSPLHKLFEWDDATAAAQQRLNQARYILRSITVVRVDEEGPSEVRAFVVIHEEDGGGQHYEATEVALATATGRRQVLEQAQRELQQLRNRYRDYRELAAIFEQAEEAVAVLSR